MATTSWERHDGRGPNFYTCNNRPSQEAPNFYTCKNRPSQEAPNFYTCKNRPSHVPKLERERRGAQKHGFRLGFLEENHGIKGFVRNIRKKERRGTAHPGSGGSPVEAP